MRRYEIVLLGIVAAVLAAAAPAGAVTVGSATGSGSNAVPGPFTLVQAKDPTAGPTYVVPAGADVLTGWKARVEAQSGATAPFKLKVLRPAAGGGFTLVGETALTIVGTDAFVDVTAAARIGVQAGDRLAVFAPSSSSWVAVSVAAGGGIAAAPGDTSGPFSNKPAGYRLTVEATVESDADGDGFGDQTQDACPDLTTLQVAPCSTDLAVSVVATPPSVVAGGVSGLVASFSAAGGPAMGATGTLTLPAGLEVLAATTASGACAGSGTLTCPLGDIPAGASRTAFLIVRGAAPGTFTVGVAAQSANPDTAPANNTAGATLQVTAGPATLQAASARFCTVPRLRGARLATARSRLARAGCALGRRSGRQGSRARVRTQGIPAGVRVAVGTKVPVTLALPRKR